MGRGGEGGSGAPGNGPLLPGLGWAGLTQPLRQVPAPGWALALWALRPGRHLVASVPLSAGYLGFYMFSWSLWFSAWIYQWQRRRSLVCSMPATRVRSE